MKNLFTKEIADEVIARIENLSISSQPKWGLMSVSQMFAHCCVTYEMVYTDKHPKPNKLAKFMLKKIVKNIVVSEKPYRKNGRTSAQFFITDEREFDTEKKRLIDYIKKTQELGEDYFDGKESHSFGKLIKYEWNNMFYKHLDHHLTQFEV